MPYSCAFGHANFQIHGSKHRCDVYLVVLDVQGWLDQYQEESMMPHIYASLQEHLLTARWWQHYHS